MKHLIAIASFFALSACSPQPQDIHYGEDMCSYCKMTIVDRQHAAQAVTNKGRVYKFDAIECLLNYVEDEGGEAQFAHLLVNDYQQPGVLIPAQESHYLISKAVPSPMGANLSAFESAKAADQMQAEKGGHVYHWKALQHHAELSGLIAD